MIHLESMGSGPRNVVLLHGCPTPPRHMEGLARALSASKRVYLVHLPGYGSSPAPAAAYTMEEAAASLEDALARAGVEEAALVGYSGGAYRALHLAARGRLRASGVVAMAGFAKLAAEQREAFLQFAEILPQGLDLSGAFVELMLPPELRAARPELVPEVAGWLASTPAEALARELRAFAASEDLLPRLRDLRIPALALVGELDHNQPPEKSREISEAMPRAELRLLPGVGHLLLREDLAATVEAVEGFLDGLHTS